MDASHVLFEDNHLLIVDKQADWVVQGAQEDQASLLESAKDYLKQRYRKPGRVFLGVVSRLDAPVTGVVPFARTSKAAARLSEQFRNRIPDKQYFALVEGEPPLSEARLEHYLVRGPDSPVTLVANASAPGAQRAILDYRCLGVHGNRRLLEVQLVTGRKHQIRCQLAANGTPIVGDRLYGAHETFPRGIALHCGCLTLAHPTLQTSLTVRAAVPSYWPAWTRQALSTERG